MIRKCSNCRSFGPCRGMRVVVGANEGHPAVLNVHTTVLGICCCWGTDSDSGPPVILSGENTPQDLGCENWADTLSGLQELAVDAPDDLVERVDQLETLLHKVVRHLQSNPETASSDSELNGWSDALGPDDVTSDNG